MYQFFDKKCVKIKDSSVSLYYSGEFFNHNNFFQDIRLISHALYLYQIKHIVALRLRYINEIKPNGVKLKEIINQEFGNYNFLPYKSDIVRALTRTEYNFEDYNLILQYGQFNLNYPSRIIKDDFILDYEAVSNNWESLSELEYTFNDLNKIIGDFYEKHLNLIVSR